MAELIEIEDNVDEDELNGEAAEESAKAELSTLRY